MNTVVNIQRL